MSLLNSERRRRRVDCEISLHRELPAHPAIVKFEHSFVDNENIYILTEFCSGSTLFSYLQSNYPTGLSEAQTRPLFLSLVQAVAFLHHYGILHRDLKLTNVLLTNTLQIRISDFGLATRLDDLEGEQEMSLCGTPNYISPEIVKSNPYGLSSDVWSLGCMLVVLLTGKPPFQGDHVSETLQLVSKGAYRPLPRVLSRAAKSLVDSILQVDPRQRLTTSEIMVHPYLASASAQHELSISPLSDCFHNSRTEKKQHRSKLRSSGAFNVPFAHLSRKRLADVGEPSRQREALRRCGDETNSGHYSVAQPIEFGASQANTSPSIWRKKAASGYNSLVDNLRRKSINRTIDSAPYSSRSEPQGHTNHRQNPDQSAAPVLEDEELSSYSSQSTTTSNLYRKHRQSVPASRSANNTAVAGCVHISRHSRQKSDPLKIRHQCCVTHRRQCSASSIIGLKGHPPKDLITPRVDSAIAQLPPAVRSLDGRCTESHGSCIGELGHGLADVKITSSASAHSENPRAPLPDMNGSKHTQAQFSPKATRSTRFANPIKVDCIDSCGPETLRPVSLVAEIVSTDQVNEGHPHKPVFGVPESPTESDRSALDLVHKYRFTTTDLRPSSQATKHGEVKLLPSGEIYVAMKNERRSHVISSDGLTIKTCGTNGIRKTCTLEDLPARTLLAYRYASKFVKLLRSKTVRIAIDSGSAKCRLYMNDDFEAILLREERKISLCGQSRVVKIASHDQILWKGSLDETAPTMREYVRLAMIWLSRCKSALEEPEPLIEKLVSEEKKDTSQSTSTKVSVKFIDDHGWCERCDEGRIWRLFFLDGHSLELEVEARTLQLTSPEGITESYKLEAGLPEEVRKRLKITSRAINLFG